MHRKSCYLTVVVVRQPLSRNNKGLAVYGTVAKSVVASGAELVAYGPFSTSNYLRQPYNSDLNFGSDDFSIMFWIYDDGTNSHQTLVSRDNREFDISRLGTTYGSKLRIYGFLAERYLSYWFTKNTKYLSWPVFKLDVDRH